ncbi:ABC transporter substrate-binding protein [Streptacidiphilus sp. NEAU-YB345]|uniref:ABC transporter substrate-binding protein n=1 Tax=Streptacidiphilus fuscans TaxID=2789292 RepID=A0A931B2G4_9ACTN|nr:ABC transporter substrate-binding protein [Streptacidiphilus fuscans]
MPFRRAWNVPVVLLLSLVALIALSGCASNPSGASGGPNSAAAGGTSADLVSSVRKVDAAAALLPAAVRASGEITVATAIGGPPSASYPDGASSTPVGQDIDITDAVAAVLGLRVNRQIAAFETILPGLSSGKYQLGVGNFGVTTERLKTVDFVTYIDDGQGFAVRAGSPIKQISSLRQLCGLTVGTGAGTTFEATLEQNAHVCTDAGQPAYRVQVYSDGGALQLGLQQGRFDVLMSTINGLRYQEKQTGGAVHYLGPFHRLDVGFVFPKGSPLTRAFQAAVQHLIADGTYRKILAAWGTTDSAITTSQIDPPESAG